MEPEDLLKRLIGLTPHPVVSFIAGPVADEIKRRRLEAGRDILLRRMAKGSPWTFREDEAASLIFDYLRAAEDGTAQQNLEIMADLIANGLGEPGFTEEAIRHLMKAVASLSYDELRVLAAFVRAVRDLPPPEEAKPTEETDQTSAVWLAVCFDLAKPGDTTPSMETVARAGALQRTGLVIAYSGWGGLERKFMSADVGRGAKISGRSTPARERFVGSMGGALTPRPVTSKPQLYPLSTVRAQCSLQRATSSSKSQVRAQLPLHSSKLRARFGCRPGRRRSRRATGWSLV